MGGLEAMKAHNEKESSHSLQLSWIKAICFDGTVVKEDRSLMNVPFVTGDKEMDAKFVKAATDARIRKLAKATVNLVGGYARQHLQCNAQSKV